MQNLSWTIAGKDELSGLIEKLDRSTDKLTKSIEALTGAAKRMGNTMGEAEPRTRRLGDEANDTARKLDVLRDRFGDITTKAKEYAVAVTAAAAVAAAAVSGLGVTFAIEKSKVDTLLAGQLGLSKDQARQLGKVTGELYAEGFTDSIQDAGNAVRATLQNNLVDPMASTEVIETMSRRTAALTRLMQEDFDRVTSAVSQMLRTKMAGSAEEAFDLLAAATQRGINKSQDLLDTINEYSTEFRQLGLDGPTALGLLSQAIQAGARDSDTAADALKEFSIRAIDASTTSAKGFQLLGLDAKKMTAQIAQGGEAASAGLATVLARLREMKDPVAQNAAAVALFGTKAEDLGKSLFAMNPAEAFRDFSAELGKTKGAMDSFIDGQQSAGQRLESVWNRAKTTLADFFTPAVDEALDMFEEWANDPEMQEWFDGIEADIKDIAQQWLPILKEGANEFFDAVKDNKEEIKLAITLIANAVGALATGFLLAGSAAVRVTGFIVDAFKTTVQFVLGYMDIFIQGSAKAFGWIPGIGPKLKDAAAQFGKFREDVNNELAKIEDNKTIHVGVEVSLGETAGALLGAGALKIANLNRRAVGGPAWAGEVYQWQEQGGGEYFIAGTTGRVQSAAESRSAGGGDGAVLGVLRVVHERPDGTVIREELLQLKRRRGFASLGLG